jgi:hypothetical protein
VELSQLPGVLRSREWWIGAVVGVVSSGVVAAFVFFTAPYLLPFVLMWPLALTLVAMRLNRSQLAFGILSSLFIVVVTLAACLALTLI